MTFELLPVVASNETHMYKKETYTFESRDHWLALVRYVKHTKSNIPNQTYQIKHTKSNIPNQTSKSNNLSSVRMWKSEWSGLAPSLCFYEFTVIFARTRKHVVRFNPTCFYVAAQWSKFVACKNWIRIRIILPWFVHKWYILEKRRGFTIIGPDFGLFLSFLQSLWQGCV